MPKYGFIKLRKELSNLVENEGHWVALRSIDLTKPTTEAQEGIPENYDQSHPDYNNIVANYYFVDKLLKSFRYLAQPGFDFQSRIGVINTKTQVYILEHDKKPKNTDYILELDLDENGIPKQPFKIQRVFRIQDAQEMRAEDPGTHHGSQIFWRCFCEEHNVGYGPRTV